MSRIDPESTGLNPAWRNSLAYTIVGAAWQDGANSTQIDAARQRLIQDMKTLEGIAPESGAYSNEVKTQKKTPLAFHSYIFPFRLLDMNSTGRNPSLALTMTNSSPSSGNTIRNRFSWFTKVSDQTSGMKVLSVAPDNIGRYPFTLDRETLLHFFVVDDPHTRLGCQLHMFNFDSKRILYHRLFYKYNSSIST